MGFFKDEARFQKARPDAAPAQRQRDVTWLANPVLQQKQALLGALLENHEEGHEASKVTMIKAMLERAGIEISGMHSLLRTHMGGTDAYVTQGGQGGRNNVTFSLTDKGLTAARELREKHRPKTAR